MEKTTLIGKRAIFIGDKDEYYYIRQDFSYVVEDVSPYSVKLRITNTKLKVHKDYIGYATWINNGDYKILKNVNGDKVGKKIKNRN